MRRGKCNMISSGKEQIEFGMSPCPNDTFAFYALVNGLLESPNSYRPVVADVEELNRMALAGELEVTKVSFGVLPEIADRYWLLPSGAALGRGCGPLVVGREVFSRDELEGEEVAVPGLHTTACRLLSMWCPCARPVPMLFSEIAQAVAAGRFSAGVIIHEGRFTYRSHGLCLIQDLGDWWEEETGLPIPLGGIVASREMGDVARQAAMDVEASVRYAMRTPGEPMPFVFRHAQEIQPDVVEQHISLYVNDYTLRLGEEGRAAVLEFMGRCGSDHAGGLVLEFNTEPESG